MEKIERNKFFNALIYPFLFVALLVFIHFIQFVFELSFVEYGIYPRTVKGLMGVLFSPLLHGDLNHLFNNSIPLIILGTSLFYFYKKVALKVTLWIYLMVGIWVWISAREAYHIGASGLLYGLFSFLLISGFLRRNTQLIAVSFFVVMVYGSMVWGIFPIKVNISFESHLWGFVAGIILAFYYKKQGPQKVEHVWEEEEDDTDEDNYWNMDEAAEKLPPQSKINYHFKPKEKE